MVEGGAWSSYWTLKLGKPNNIQVLVQHTDSIELREKEEYKSSLYQPYNKKLTLLYILIN